MRTPALAIGWSLWARHRAANLAMLAAIPICAVLYQVFRGMIPSRMAATHSFVEELPLTLLPMVLSFVWVLYVCAQTETEWTRGFSGLPERLFVHPVSTRFLVLCHMAFGIVTIVLVHLAWSYGVFAPLGVKFELRWPLLLSALAMVSFQGAVWGLASFPLLRGAVICAGGLTIGPLLAVASAPGIDWGGREKLFAGLTLATLPVVCVAALGCVGGERRGGWQPWAPVRRLALRLFDALLLRQRPFEGPAAALAWLEWRRRGWVTGVWIAVTVAGSVFMMPVQALVGAVAELPVWYPLLQALFWPVFLGASLGSAVSKTDGAGRGAISPFQAIKPITTSEIVFIKIRIDAIGIVLGWIAAVPLAFLLTLWPKWRELCLNTEFQALAQWLHADIAGISWLIVMMFLAILLGWHGMTIAMSLSLSGRTSVIPWRAILWLASVPLLTGAALLLFRRPGLAASVKPWLWVGLSMFMAWKIVATVRAFSEARRRALWSHGQLQVSVALWILVAAAIVGGVLLCHWKLSFPTELLLLATAGLWPGGELARTVINLAIHRHR